MASTITPATLTVKISESVILNGSEQGNTNTITVSNINEISREIFHCDTSENNLLWFIDEIASADTGSGHNRFLRNKVMYVRITNLDDTNYVTLTVRNHSDDEFAIKLSAGASFIVNGASSTAVNNIFDASGNAISPASTLGDLYSINGLANTANCDLEMFVASI